MPNRLVSWHHLCASCTSDTWISDALSTSETCSGHSSISNRAALTQAACGVEGAVLDTGESRASAQLRRSELLPNMIVICDTATRFGGHGWALSGRGFAERMGGHWKISCFGFICPTGGPDLFVIPLDSFDHYPPAYTPHEIVSPCLPPAHPFVPFRDIAERAHRADCRLTLWHINHGSTDSFLHKHGPPKIKAIGYRLVFHCGDTAALEARGGPRKVCNFRTLRTRSTCPFLLRARRSRSSCPDWM